MKPKHDLEREEFPTLEVSSLADAIAEAAPGATYLTDDGFTVTFGNRTILPNCSNARSDPPA